MAAQFWPAQPLRFLTNGGTFEARRHNDRERQNAGKLHGGHADRLRYPSRRGRNAHHAAALSRRSLERAGGKPGGDLAMVQRGAFDQLGASHAICNVLYGAQAVFDSYMAAAFCKAINDWIAAEWLARDPRLRASIVVPMQALIWRSRKSN